MRSIFFAILCAATPAMAEDFICAGQNPDWELTITGDTGIFEFERKNSFNIPDTAVALGQEWPQAKPLIGDFDTAIAILDQDSCPTGPIAVDVLTQRGQSPILLTGCCEIRE